MPSPRPVSETLAEARELVARLSGSLPSVVDPASISMKAKIPFKVLCFREALIWRTEELARLEAFERSDFAAAVMLTRGVTESAAAVWYLKELLERQIAAPLGDELDETAMKLFMGQRTDATGFPAAINILSMIGRLDREIPGFRKGYDALSEYAHPNWRGTAGLFSKADAVLGLGHLVAALQLFEHAYNLVTDLMSTFIAACEAQLEARDA